MQKFRVHLTKTVVHHLVVEVVAENISDARRAALRQGRRRREDEFCDNSPPKLRVGDVEEPTEATEEERFAVVAQLCEETLEDMGLRVWTVSDLAKASGLPMKRMQQILLVLEAKGLVYQGMRGHWKKV